MLGACARDARRTILGYSSGTDTQGLDRMEGQTHRDCHLDRVERTIIWWMFEAGRKETEQGRQKFRYQICVNSNFC